jgi:hypothetical protein
VFGIGLAVRLIVKSKYLGWHPWGVDDVCTGSSGIRLVQGNRLRRCHLHVDASDGNLASVGPRGFSGGGPTARERAGEGHSGGAVRQLLNEFLRQGASPRRLVPAPPVRGCNPRFGGELRESARVRHAFLLCRVCRFKRETEGAHVDACSPTRCEHT